MNTTIINYKRPLIHILFLISLLFIVSNVGTIFAANHTINETSSGGIASGILATGDNETLFLTSGTYNKTGNDTNITIRKNITIMGNGSANTVFIDARKRSGIFFIGNNTIITFINITFLNGNTTNSGGAIYNNYTNSVLTFINCTFLNNNASLSGGAIYNNGTNMKVTNCNFTGNNADASSNNFLNGGGAIFNNGLNMIVIESSFTSNTAPLGNGGAIVNKCFY